MRETLRKCHKHWHHRIQTDSKDPTTFMHMCASAYLGCNRSCTPPALAIEESALVVQRAAVEAARRAALCPCSLMCDELRVTSSGQPCHCSTKQSSSTHAERNWPTQTLKTLFVLAGHQSVSCCSSCGSRWVLAAPLKLGLHPVRTPACVIQAPACMHAHGLLCSCCQLRSQLHSHLLDLARPAADSRELAAGCVAAMLARHQF